MTTSDPNDTESYGDYSVDDEDQPGAEDFLLDEEGMKDELDRGYSPPEHYSAGQGFGNTPYEEATGETVLEAVRAGGPPEGTIPCASKFFFMSASCTILLTTPLS